MTPSLIALKWGAVGFILLSIAAAAYAIIADPGSLPYRYWALYVTRIERQLHNMFLPTKGSLIAFGQVFALALAVGTALYWQSPYFYLLIPFIVLGPPLYIERLRQQRLKAIDATLDGFILSLANALKTTPSIGNALSSTWELLEPPLADEVALALKEMRVGSPLDQALLNMAGRVQSVRLDATLSSVLIGRQVGGHLTQILETTAATLREMARLQGVVRSKTAEGKAQLGVLAVFPAVVLLGFDLLSPGYFDPLTSSGVGFIIIVVAGVLWVLSLVMARKVLSVDL